MIEVCEAMIIFGRYVFKLSSIGMHYKYVWFLCMGSSFICSIKL